MNTASNITKQLHHHVSKHWKILFLAALATLILGGPLDKQANATVTLVPRPGYYTVEPSGMPTESVLNYFTACDAPYTNNGLPASPTNPGKAAAFQPWIASPTNTKADENIVVPYGADTVQLSFYFPAVTCFAVGEPGTYTSSSAAYVLDSSVRVLEANAIDSTGQQFAIGDLVRDFLLTGMNNTKGNYVSLTIPFQFNPMGTFIYDETYTINIRSRNINHFSDNAYTCVGPGEKSTSPGNFTECPDRVTSYTFRIVVPQGRVEVHTYKVDASGNKIGDVGGVVIQTCDFTANNKQRKDTRNFSPAIGYTEFDMPGGRGYCADITSTGESPGSDSIPGFEGPFIRPWLEDYGTCQGRTGPPYTGDCRPNDRYDCQAAGGLFDTTGCGGTTTNIDRASDNGFDFIYIESGGLTCKPASSIVTPGVPMTFQAEGGEGFYSWSVTPSAGVDPSGDTTITPEFTTTFDNNETYYIGVVSGSKGATCRVDPPTVPVTYTRPYFKVYGGDVVAGSGFLKNTACTKTTNAGILAFNKNTVGGGAGSGTELAAQAYAAIKGFSSAAMRSPPVAAINALPVTGLSFASQASPTPTGYGGSFGDAPCILDYANAPISSAYTKETSALSLENSSGLKVPDTPPGSPKRRVIRVNGDVTIKGNVEYQGSTSWSSIDDIPSLYVIAVGGDIHIHHLVDQLDGVYIAIPKFTDLNNDTDFLDPGEVVGGTIRTCTNSNSILTAGSLAASCKKSLTVNGAFIAKTIKLLRTIGDYDSTDPAIAASVNELANPSKMAEIFKYTPEMFLVPSPFTTNASYQSITNLPPVL